MRLTFYVVLFIAGNTARLSFHPQCVYLQQQQYILQAAGQLDSYLRKNEVVSESLFFLRLDLDLATITARRTENRTEMHLWY